MRDSDAVPDEEKQPNNGSLAQLAVVFHRKERAIEKQGPEERSECGIQMLFPTKKTAKQWEFSSAGSEHLPYKQRVGGSNPSTPTKN
jgi:hypothetical protein